MDVMSPRHLKIANWVVLALLVLIGYVGWGREFALGVLLGGLVVIINFHLLHRFLKGSVEAARDPESKGRAQAFFAGKQILRFLAMVLIMFFLVGRGWVNIFGLVVGLSTVVLTLTLAGINEMRKLKK